MRKYSATVIWTSALCLLYFMDISKGLPSFCLFKLIGFKSCFGCGIGHSIYYALHFNFRQSFQEHVLGIPATICIIYNIFESIYQLTKTNKHGRTTNAYDATRLAT